MSWAVVQAAFRQEASMFVIYLDIPAALNSVTLFLEIIVVVERTCMVQLSRRKTL